MRTQRLLKAAFVYAALLLALAVPATAGPGVNLRWNQCFSDGGVQSRAFACDTNAGGDRLVVSLVLDSDMPEVSGDEIVLQVQSASPTLPSWWSFKEAGGTGACTGCDVPVCLVIDQLTVDTPVLSDNRRLTGGASAPNSEFARWQNSLETNASLVCTVMSGCRHEFACVDASTPTRNSTWGEVKALNR